jgi:hypothetical protein
MDRRLRSPPERPFFMKMGSVPPTIVSAHFSSFTSRSTCATQNRQASSGQTMATVKDPGRPSRRARLLPHILHDWAMI